MLPIISVPWNWLVNDVFGSVFMAGLFLVFVLFCVLMAVRVNPAWAFISLAPMTYMLALSGMLGAGWVSALVIVVMSAFWAFILWRLIGE